MLDPLASTYPAPAAVVGADAALDWVLLHAWVGLACAAQRILPGAVERVHDLIWESPPPSRRVCAELWALWRVA